MDRGWRALETETRRIVRRWHELPEAQAAEFAPLLRDFVQSLADGTRHACGRETLDIPDLGVAALGDQLSVIVYDAHLAGVTDGLLENLAQLRRSLP